MVPNTIKLLSISSSVSIQHVIPIVEKFLINYTNIQLKICKIEKKIKNLRFHLVIKADKLLLTYKKKNKKKQIRSEIFHF